MIFQSVKFKIIESLKISYINKIHYQEIIINIPDWIKIPFKQRNFHFYSLYFCSKEGLINVDSKATTSTKTIIFQFYYYSTLEKYKKEIRVSISSKVIFQRRNRPRSIIITANIESSNNSEIHALDQWFLILFFRGEKKKFHFPFHSSSVKQRNPRFHTCSKEGIIIHRLITAVNVETGSNNAFAAKK